jgi:SpoVK/Ycf46/Vps4 family AAA+-type ATPase
VALWGKPGAGKKFLAQGLCGELRIPLLVADTPSLLAEPAPLAAVLGRVLREGALRHCAVFLDRADGLVGDSGPAASARRQLLDTAREYRGLLFVGSRTAPPDGDDALVFEVSDPDFDGRRALWSSAIAGAPHEVLLVADAMRPFSLLKVG